MDDLARLGVDLGIVLARLKLGERVQSVVGELGPEEQSLQARDERVPAEDGHEPGHAGGGQLAREARILVHAQGREVSDRLGERLAELLPGGAQLWNTQMPGR
jgi:hypothetical protein